MSGFSRTFANVFGGGDSHPALAQPAGLSSGAQQRANDRGACANDARDYVPNGRTQWQPALPLPTQVHANLSSADIAGTRPANRPIVATKDSVGQFQTHRITSPLEPRYHLPSIPAVNSVTADRIFGSGGGANSTSPNSPTAGPSRFDVSDIAGTKPRCVSVPSRGERRDTLNISDINATRTKPAARQPFCLTTGDIQGASPSHLHPSIPSPGKGTLAHEDIEGSAPGNFRAQHAPLAFSTSLHAGRWPLPATSRHQFATSMRKTVLVKPIMSVD